MLSEQTTRTALEAMTDDLEITRGDISENGPDDDGTNTRWAARLEAAVAEAKAELARLEREPEVHAPSCPRRGFRYGLTREDGRVVMFCKNSRCSALRVV